MDIDFENSNTTGELIAYVLYGQQSNYCIAEVEYWIAEWWNGYVDVTKSSLEKEYFLFLRQFEVNYESLQKAYVNLIPKVILLTWKVISQKYLSILMNNTSNLTFINRNWRGECKKIGRENMAKWKH